MSDRGSGFSVRRLGDLVAPIKCASSHQSPTPPLLTGGVNRQLSGRVLHSETLSQLATGASVLAGLVSRQRRLRRETLLACGVLVASTMILEELRGTARELVEADAHLYPEVVSAGEAKARFGMEPWQVADARASFRSAVWDRLRKMGVVGIAEELNGRD